MLKSVVYISSDDRSGSTMLDLVLANSPDVFAAGELHNLPAYVFNENSFFNPRYGLNCLCGKSFYDCEFWTKVESELPISFKQLRLRAENPAMKGVSRYLNVGFCAVDSRVRRCFPVLLKNKMYQRLTGARHLARNYFHLYDAIAKVSGKQIVIDSSKLPFRFRFLHDYRPESVKVILLYRNPEAVVYSKLKRGEPLERSAMRWNDIVGQMDLFSKEIPAENKIQINYERLCKETESEICRICSFLGIKFTREMLQLRKVGIHHIGGSPSKFDTTRTGITFDRQFFTKLSKDQIEHIDLLTPNAKKIQLYS